MHRIIWELFQIKWRQRAFYKKSDISYFNGNIQLLIYVYITSAFKFLYSKRWTEMRELTIFKTKKKVGGCWIRKGVGSGSGSVVTRCAFKPQQLPSGKPLKTAPLFPFICGEHNQLNLFAHNFICNLTQSDCRVRVIVCNVKVGLPVCICISHIWITGFN